MSASANQIIKAVAEVLSPVELEQYRLERLRELRMTIDALRNEQVTADPLLAWVIEHEGAEKARIP
ncbi:MAG TPA: hypothetical protein VM146_17955 [Steroidobacteraceae bacterium]|nr:hypothetical protein [Steroidobacteraceae bacterium]